LHTVHNEDNRLLAVDYKPDGTMFATGGSDCVVRVYNESTRKCLLELAGGGTGEPGHNNKIFSVVFDKED
jgi:COMPASS component SWD3